MPYVGVASAPAWVLFPRVLEQWVLCSAGARTCLLLSCSQRFSGQPAATAFACAGCAAWPAVTLPLACCCAGATLRVTLMAPIQLRILDAARLGVRVWVALRCGQESSGLAAKLPGPGVAFRRCSLNVCAQEQGLQAASSSAPLPLSHYSAPCTESPHDWGESAPGLLGSPHTIALAVGLRPQEGAGEVIHCVRAAFQQENVERESFRTGLG